jgi:hypothetical protein
MLVVEAFEEFLQEALKNRRILSSFLHSVAENHPCESLVDLHPNMGVGILI